MTSKMQIDGRRSWSTALIIFCVILPMWHCTSDQSKEKQGRTVETFEDRWKSFPYRDQKWIPENGLFLFCEKWTWRYLNTAVREGESWHSGEISVFLDPVTGTMLFTKEDAGIVGQDVDFVMSIGDQHYVCYSPADRPKEMQVFELGKSYDFGDDARKHFDKKVQGTQSNREFARGKYPISGQEYTWSDPVKSGQHQAYLTEVPFYFASFYQLNELSADLRLPIKLDLSRQVPPRMAVLSHRYELAPEVVEFELVSVVDADKHLDLTLYD